MEEETVQEDYYCMVKKESDKKKYDKEKWEEEE